MRILLFIIGALMIIGFFKSEEAPVDTPNNAPKKTVISHDGVTSGIIHATPGTWQGVTSHWDRVEVRIQVDNVKWLIRYDRDDRRVYTMYPRNWRTNSFLEEKSPWNVIEVSIQPDQGVTSAPILWTRCARRNASST